jgi:hypothetical protein
VSFDNDQVDVALSVIYTGGFVEFQLNATLPYVDELDQTHCPTTYLVDFNKITNTTLGLAGTCESQAPYNASSVGFTTTKPLGSSWTNGTMLDSNRFTYHDVPTNGYWAAPTKAGEEDNRKVNYVASGLTLSVIKNYCFARDDETTPDVVESEVSGYSAYSFAVYVCSVYKAGMPDAITNECKAHAPYVSTCHAYPQRVLVSRMSAAVIGTTSVHDTLVYLKSATLENCDGPGFQDSNLYPRRMVFEAVTHMWTRAGDNSQKIVATHVEQAAELTNHNPGHMPHNDTIIDSDSKWDSEGEYWEQTVTIKSECKNMHVLGVKDPSAFANDLSADHLDRFSFDWTYKEYDWEATTSTSSNPVTLPKVTSRISFDPTLDPDIVDTINTQIDSTSVLTLYRDFVLLGNEFDISDDANKFREGERVCVRHKLERPYNESFAFAPYSMQACCLNNQAGTNYEELYTGNNTLGAVDRGCNQTAWASHVGTNNRVNPIVQEFSIVSADGFAIMSDLDVAVTPQAEDDAHFDVCFNLVADAFTYQFDDAPITIKSTGTVSFKAAAAMSFSAISTRAATPSKNSQTAAFVVAARETDTSISKDDKSEAWKLGLIGVVLSSFSHLMVLLVVCLLFATKTQQKRFRPLLSPSKTWRRTYYPGHTRFDTVLSV